MTVSITSVIKNNSDYPETIVQTFNNIWEIQDNQNSEIVIKENDHTCIRINKRNIKKIEILPGDNK